MPMESLMTEFDVIVIGGGINGLTAAAYLSKAGLSTVVIERRDQIGTHAVTEEQGVPGFRMSTHATAIMCGFGPVMADLELDKYGLELSMRREGFAMPFRDGKVFAPDVWDANVNYKKWERFSKRDAETFKAINNAAIRNGILKEYREKVFSAAPTLDRWDLWMKLFAKLPRMPSDWADMTGFELADHLYEDEHLKAQITTVANAYGFPPQEKVTGPQGVVVMSTFSGFAAGQAIGGAHQVPHALFRCIIHNGGKILQSCEVEKIIIEDGRAKGVILGPSSAYGEKRIIARKAIVSDLSPVPTFLHLIGEDNLEKGVAQAVKNYDYDWHILFHTSCMTTAMPRWKSASFDDGIQKAWAFNLGVESMRDVERTVDQIKAGSVPEPINALGGCFALSMHDKTATPEGFHNLQFWSDVPYNLKSGGAEEWDVIKDDIAEKVVRMVEDYSPGFGQSVKMRIAVTPLDSYRKNPSAIYGSWAGGPRKPGQLYLDRTFQGCNAPRTPFKGLYLSNGIWPMSGSVLLDGYVAACEVTADLGISRPSWWTHGANDWIEGWYKKNQVAVRPIVS